jgi:predicted RNA methylase
MDRLRKWLRRTFPNLYGRFGHYFHTHYPTQRRILRHAREHPELYSDPELADAVKHLAEGSISVFSFPGSGSYDTLPVRVHVDEDGFPWVDHGGRRLWFRRGSGSAAVALNYRRLLQEQDAASPHRYRAESFDVNEGDLLLDVGSAEGMFALDNVERASRVILFEVDPAWIGALERTFEPWRDKVTIINRYASDTDDDRNVTIDTVTRDLPAGGALFLKLDVEGAEERVLRGAEEALSRPDTRAVVCTYHRQDDHRSLSEMMRERGFTVATSPGHMLFLHDRDLRPPFFRRGVIYCGR